MKSINKTLFPSNTTPAVQIIGYQTVRPSVPVVVRAFPNCVNTWHHNFFPTGTSSRQDIPVLPTQTSRTCQANKETQPKGNAAENPRVQVSEPFFYCAKCSTSYLAKCFLIRCHGSKKKISDSQ